MLHWLNALVGLPWWAAAVAKVTALLAVGWGLHLVLLLVRANPRWRVMLWRGVVAGIPLVMLLTPALSWRLAVPRAPLPPFHMPELPPDYQPDLASAPMVAAVATAAEPPQAYEASPEPEPPPLPRVSFREWATDRAWMLIGILWLGVSAAFGAQMLIGLMRLRRLLARATPAPEPLQRLLGQVARSLGYPHGIRLLVSDSFSSPLLAELRVPTIVLPRRLLRLDRRSELAGILAHEVGHLPSRDVFWSLAARLLLLPLWFHPLAWPLRRAHGAACEQVCDVVAAEYVGDVQSYSSTLARAALELACPQALVGGIPMLGPSEIVHRLRLLSRGVSAPRIGGRRLAAYAAVGLALAVALAGVRLVYAGTKPADSGMRVLEFPSDRPMGSLYAPTREAEEPEWQMLAGGEHDRDYVAEAQGRIKVPQNARVRLVLSGVGVRDLSPLSRLGPDDLQQLEFPTWEPALLDDRGLAHLRGLTGLRVLQVYHSVVTDRGLESLRGLKSLRRLQMRSDRITDRGLEALKDLESLRALAISSKQLTDAGLARIAALQPLEILSVLSDRITDAGVAQLAELKSLRCLSLWSRGVRGPGLAHLAKIPALERLVFAGGYAKAGYVTDESLRYVSNIRSLKALDVSYCPITDAGMQYVGQMSQLEELNLNGTKVTSASLEHVKRLRSLKCLPGPFGGVKLAALQQLREMKSLEALSLHPSALCEQGVALLAELPRLRELEVKTPAHLVTSPTDKDLALLRRLPSLERLGVSCIRVTDEGLDHIAALKDLKSLNLWWCDLITDEGLAKLAALKSLEKLYLCRADHTPGLTTGGVSRLNELTRLRSLHINWAPLARTSPLDLTKLTALEWLWLEGDLRDDDLACLANLKRLNYLTLQGRFGDAGMAHLRNLGSPEVLQLTGKELTDKSLGAVAPLRSLYFLKLGAGRFTADGLRQLYGLKRLSQVTLVSETAIRPEAIRELAAQLPRTVIGGGPKVLARETRPPGMPTGERAPAFALRTLDGKNVRLEDYRGKVLLLHFWASWARESVADLPALKKLHQAFAANPDFAVLSISLDDDQAEARRVLQQHAPGWPQACVGRNAQVVRDYVAKLKPTSPSRYRLVGRDGAIWLPEFRSVTETDTGLTESHQLDVLVLHVNQALRATPTKTAD